jgi:hypothetical protein
MSVIFSSVVGVVIVAWMGTTYFTETKIEKPIYTVIEKKSGYEIREYDSYLVTSVKTQGDLDQSLNQGFRTLAGYIFGNNQTEEKIKMTAPVIQRKNQDVQTVEFVVPKKYTMATLPKPNDPNIKFEIIEAKRLAAISFIGYANEERVKSKEKELLAKLKSDMCEFIGNPIYASYNSPFAFPLLKRHEILVEIKN